MPDARTFVIKNTHNAPIVAWPMDIGLVFKKHPSHFDRLISIMRHEGFCIVFGQQNFVSFALLFSIQYIACADTKNLGLVLTESKV